MKKIYNQFKISIILSLGLMMLCFVNINIAYAYSNLWVQEPRTWSISGQGTIDEAIFTVEPKGIYAECNLIYTFSAEGLGATNQDTLEVSFDFMLPEGSMVTNSYLLIGDSLVEARLLDQWTATQIYEGIVQRRRDPSILYKQWGNQYFLRIFPMAGNESRKAIVTYLVPANWTKDYTSILLPTEILQSSANHVDKISVYLYRDSEWQNPRILEVPYGKFIQVDDPEFGQCEKIEINHNGENYSSVSVGFDSPMTNGLYLKTFDIGGEGFYHLAFLPSKVLNINEPKRVAFIVDYDKNMTWVSKIDIIDKIQAYIKEYFSEYDEFNLFYSDGREIQSLSGTWIPATQPEIDGYFGSLDLEDISDTSYLMATLPATLEIIKNDECKVFLITSAYNILNESEADTVISNLYKIKDPLPQFNIINLMENYYYVWDFMDIYYYGNSYLYEKLAKLTSGEYLQISWENTFNFLMTQMFQSLDGILNSFDLHTSMLDGFCYSRYNINGEGATYMNKPILQVGKYYGSYPFKVEIAALNNDNLFLNTFSFNLIDVNTADTMIEQAWAGNYIESLENSNYNYLTTREIIEISLEYRVLSLYTAFLALEPGMAYEIPEGQDINEPTRWGGGEIALAEDAMFYSVKNDGGVSGTVYENRGEWYVSPEYTNIDEPFAINNSAIDVNYYPNPFIDHVSIVFELNNENDLSQTYVQVVNLSGQVVKVFSQPDFEVWDNQIQIEWNGKNENGSNISKGTYILHISTPSGQASVKLMKIQ
ncbi:MAG: T9SS type A sorting domain-containing protein [Bacteroidales bacterium]|nr:T9SS type A sorting domain-containing protein [Bacteroidales bacterium]